MFNSGNNQNAAIKTGTMFRILAMLTNEAVFGSKVQLGKVKSIILIISYIYCRNFLSIA